MKRSTIFWGFILLILGGLMFADAAGIRLPGRVEPMEYFWPMALILAGGWMLLGVFVRRKPGVAEQASVSLQGAADASVKISHGAGDFRLTSGAGLDLLAEGSFSNGLEQTAVLDGQRLKVTMHPPQDGFPFGNMDRHDWDMRFNSGIPISLKLEMGANKADVDLRDLHITSLKVDTGASDTRIVFPAKGRLRADLDLGAASLDLTFPEGVSARFRISQGASGVDIDKARFPRTGEFYQSPDFETALNAVDVTIDAGAAGIKIH